MRPDQAVQALLAGLSPDKPSMTLQRITGLTVAATLALGSLAMPATGLAHASAGHARHHRHGHAARAMRHSHKAHHSRHNRRTHHLRHGQHHAVMAHIALVGGAR